MILNFKFDRGNLWLFFKPESHKEVVGLNELFLYLDEEGKYRGEEIGIDITNLLAYTNARHNFRLSHEASPHAIEQPPAGGQEGQEGKPKPPTPPAEQ